jgi:ribonucleoside-diphosphate reductase alpha chain
MNSSKLTFSHVFSSPEIHPFDAITWESRDAHILGRDGVPVFSQKGIRVPTTWSETAYTIAAQKYFRGRMDSERREKGIDDLITRVVTTIARWGLEDGYFDEANAKVFEYELTHLILHQMGAFNSPVWFNVGVDPHPQCSACFILHVEDSLTSILELAHTEAMIFKGGSGSGMNFSAVRSSKEELSGGGRASGPVSFMRGFDAFAGVIKSGGKTRRAAKMVILNVDHPDVVEFIRSKITEEDKALALVRAGYDGSFDGEAYASVFFQNANHSVRVSDEFMRAVEADAPWGLRAVTDGRVLVELPARDLWRQICTAAHRCGDPGLQFHDTVNRMHTCPAHGSINASNPCSEFMFLDESACNLASLNLLKFQRADGVFDLERFQRAVEVFITAMDIIVDRASYPTENIGANSRKFRPLGLGYTNLGGLLVTLGLPYDSDEGRDLAAHITSFMTAASFKHSARLTASRGPFEGYAGNEAAVREVLGRHAEAAAALPRTDRTARLGEASDRLWGEVLEAAAGGVRNSQVTLLAPTGTIGFMMDSDSTGIEPLVALVMYKQLVGGGSLRMVSSSVPLGLAHLGYSPEQIAAIMEHLQATGGMEGAPFLREEHLPVFDAALRPSQGTRTVHFRGHIGMMAAVQPFLSGAISKTVNVPETTTVEEIADIYLDAWRMGLKSIALYREGSKGTAPLSTAPPKQDAAPGSPATPAAPMKLQRKRLSAERYSLTHKFEVGGHEGYVTVGYYDDGTPGEVFIAMAKEGSTISGLMDAFAIGISVALQHGVPLHLFCEKFMHTRFEPSGITSNPNIPMASSLLDYLFRWLSIHHPQGVNERIRQLFSGDFQIRVTEPVAAPAAPASGEPTDGYVVSSDAPVCSDCGFVMVRNGACYKCVNCGATSGCS